MIDNSSIEYKSSISDLVDTINSNKMFSKLILYSLNTLKSYLVVQNQSQATDNSINILQKDFIKVIRSTYSHHLNNEEVLIKTGEILFYITSNLSNKQKDFEIFKNSKGIDLIKEIIEKLPDKFLEANKIFLKNFQIIIEAMQNLSNFNLEEYSSILFSLIDKFNGHNDLMIYLFETLKKISSIKKFKDIVTNDFLNIIFSIISTTSSQKIATLGLQILDFIVKTIDSREMIRSSKPISFIVKLLKKFKDDNLLSFHACNFLSKVLEKEDVYIFLKIMKLKNLKNVEKDLDNDLQFQGGLIEIKDMVSNQDEESFNLLKKNITRVLILMSKDKNFLQLLKEINSLDIFVGLLKSDIEVYSYKSRDINFTSDEIYVIEHILPDLLRLILSLLKTYDLDYDVEFNLGNLNCRPSIAQRTSLRLSRLSLNNSITNNNSKIFASAQNDSPDDSFISLSNNQNTTMKDIYFCLFRSLYLFNNDKHIVYDILDYISNKEKKLMEDFLKDFDMNEIKDTMTILLKNYYDSKWIYHFLHKMLTVHVFPVPENFILENMQALSKSVESLRLIFDNEKKDSVLNLIYQTTLNLIITSSGSYNFNFNENSFQELYNFCIKLLTYISENKEENEHFLNKEIINSLITLIFVSSENKNFGAQNVEEKCKLILNFIKKIMFDINYLDKENLVSDFSKYLLLRLNRLIDMKLDQINKLLFNDEMFCDFILMAMSSVKSHNNKIDEQITKDTLHIIIYTLNQGDTVQISRFLRENGFILLLQLCLHGIYDFDINKLIIQIIQSFSTPHFKESAMILKNFFAFRNFINQLKEIKFSKGINEKIYYEILVFVKNIIKSCEYTEAAEETNLIDHLVNEYNDIYCFYLDTKNRILEILSEILSMFSKERAMLKGLLNSKLPVIMENVLKNISENFDESGNDKIVEHLVNVFISFFKSKEYSKLIYNNYKGSLEIIKNITFNGKLSENCLNKLLTLCHLLVEYENSDITKDKIITPAFFRELSMKIPSNQKILKEMIEKCIILIENPFTDKIRRSINDSNSKLIRELSELVKADRKNAMKRREGTMTSNMTGMVSNLLSEGAENKNETRNEEDIRNTVGGNNFEIPHNLRKRRSLININENPMLKNHFDNIINNINLITEMIIDPERREEINIEQESEQLSDLLKMLCIFAKNEDNIRKIYESGIIDKLIHIMEDNNDILTFAKDQGFNLIEKLIEEEELVNRIFENGRACEFFLKELNKICKIYYPDNSEYIRNKVYIVTKIISKLSSEKIFVVNNSDYLSFENIFAMLSTIQCDKEIILNILVIFNNILINNSSRDLTNFKVSAVITQLWKKYNEIRVIEKIMKIIENLYLEESIIRDLLDTDLVENINDVLRCSKTDSDGILNLLELIDILMFHRYFAAKIIEQKTLNNLVNAVTMNMFNTKIIEKSGSIFLKGAKLDKNFITILGVYGIKEFCLQILSKYMTTCHSNIIKQTQELIFVLISDENNLAFFSKGENMDIMLKTFKINIKNRDHVLLSLKLINVITTKDVELKVEKTREKRNTISAPKDKPGSKTTLIKITSTTSDESGVTYDFTILIEIINEILSTYDEYIDIIMQLCELINNIFKISNEIWLKKFMMDVIVNNADKYLVKQDYVEIFLSTMYMMVKSDKSILDIDCTSILYYVSKILSVKLNYNIVLTILKLLKQVARSKNINTSSNLTEIIKILKFLEESKGFHDDEVILLFSQILGYLCVNTSFYKEVSNEFIVFLLDYLLSKPTNSSIHTKLLEDLKNISVYFHIRGEENANKVAELTHKTFTFNLNDKNKKNVINIFQIISSLCIQSEDMKVAMNELKFHEELKGLLNKDSFDDTLLDYQAKGCLLNLKLKKGPNTSSKLTNASTLRSMSIVFSQVEVKDEVKAYLQTERVVKIYTDKGEAKEKFVSMNENLDKIIAYNKKKGSLETFDQMDIKEMDSCVRSCGTAAFSKAKGFFTKKPKPARCFSILGIKSLQGQKTFNVECEKEEECIKYVDYISIIIQNYKTMKEDLNTDSNMSSLTNQLLK